jgi:hypothetical protein
MYIYSEAKMQQGAFSAANAQTPWLQPITTSGLDQLQLCHHTNCNSMENHFVQKMYRLSQLQMCDLHRLQLDGLAIGCEPIAIRPN